MSITIQSGHDSLVSLGLGVSEIASLYSLGRRLGNWMTAQTGDMDLLALIDQDEMDVLRRRGLLNLQRWNKQWRKSMELLINQTPQKLEGPIAEKALGDFSRFTATMVTVVAALDPFVDTITFMKSILKQVLMQLLGPTEYGEELLTSQLNSRVNAWRSSALVRGLIEKSRGIHSALLAKDDIESGFMPHSELQTVAGFLSWLLGDNSEEFITASSDIRGIAICLKLIGFDQLGVSDESEISEDHPYRLKYLPNSIFMRGHKGWKDRQRTVCTTVSLSQPEESLTKFPIDHLTASRCRFAWKYGAEASLAVHIGVGTEPVDTADPEGAEKFEELQYQFIQSGAELFRADSGHFPLASAHAFFVNREFVRGLESALDQESDETLTWILAQTRNMDQEPEVDPSHISSGMVEKNRINSYTVFQAFMMGYYYSLFVFNLMDTEKLTIKTIDGAWGFRDTKFLALMRSGRTLLKNTGMRMARTSMLTILAMLTTGNAESDLERGRRGRARGPLLGFIGKRTIIINSIIGPCHSPMVIGRFTILDCDTSGIPCDSSGYVKSGVPVPYMDGRTMRRPESLGKSCVKNVGAHSPMEDFTRHIEADWNGNPDEMLLVFRYRGRRLGSVDPSDADTLFWHTYLQRRHSPATHEPSETLPEAYECTVNDVLAGTLITPKSKTFPVLVQAFNKPCMRYALVAFYNSKGVVVASSTDLGFAASLAAERSKAGQGDNIIIAGEIPDHMEPVNMYRTKHEERGIDSTSMEHQTDRIIAYNDVLGRVTNL